MNMIKSGLVLGHHTHQKGRDRLMASDAVHRRDRMQGGRGRLLTRKKSERVSGTEYRVQSTEFIY